MYDKDLTIFSVFHKEYPIPNCSFIKPIQVGEGQNKVNLGFLSDNIGDNISVKNNRFCETTALYWIWKNLSKIDSEYIGLAHYRRYFSLPEFKVKQKIWGEKKIEDTSEIYTKPLSEASLNEISSSTIKDQILTNLSEKQIILAKASAVGHLENYLFNLKDQFIYYHLIEDWIIFEKTLEKLAPDYFEFAQSLFSKKSMNCYNMFIAKKSFVEDYCSWLFPILFELEENIKISPYPYQNRTIGFLSERLLNLYVQKNSLSVSEMPIVYFT